jgi:hypothetical protein
VPYDSHKSGIDAIIIFHVVGNIQSDFEIECRGKKIPDLHWKGYA